MIIITMSIIKIHVYKMTSFNIHDLSMRPPCPLTNVGVYETPIHSQCTILANIDFGERREN